MRKRLLIIAVALWGCGGGGGGSSSGGLGHRSPANLAGDWAFPVGQADMGSSGPDNLTLHFEERGDADACLPAGARSIAISLQTRDHAALAPGTFTFGGPSSVSDGGASDGGSGGGGASASDGGGAVDAGPAVQVLASYTDGDAGLIDLFASAGSVTAAAVSTDLSALGRGNSGSFSLTFVANDGTAHTVNGAYDLSQTCQ